ncbi:SNF2 helicase, partial [Cylindrospermum sp. FACHB-282]|nr:SNF2 helicase [Cylindrospermum sp. FACHB-282]
MKQLGAMKRQKSVEVSAKNGLGDVETHSSGVANCG